VECLKIRAHDFRAKIDSSKKKRKGSKADNTRRTCEQLEDNYKNVKKIIKIIDQEPSWLNK